MTQKELKPSQGLLNLIEANAPYWGAEAEVIRSYWDSPVRTQATDTKWLTHQIYKEYWNGVMPYQALFYKQLPIASSKEQRQELMALAEIVYEEVEHFNMFADLYSTLTGNDYKLTPEQLKKAGAWTENDGLVTLRKNHITESADIGPRATRFTEGGYVAFFSEGMKLAGGNDFESELAKICKIIHDDEFNHMLLGIIETDNHHLSDSDWQMLERFTVEQTRQRVIMRNAQFSRPVSDDRMDELLAGQADPVIFDFNYAAQLLNKAAA